jgi:hypothetical protein
VASLGRASDCGECDLGNLPDLKFNNESLPEVRVGAIDQRRGEAAILWFRCARALFRRTKMSTGYSQWYFAR